MFTTTTTTTTTKTQVKSSHRSLLPTHHTKKSLSITTLQLSHLTTFLVFYTFRLHTARYDIHRPPMHFQTMGVFIRWICGMGVALSGAIRAYGRVTPLTFTSRIRGACGKGREGGPNEWKEGWMDGSWDIWTGRPGEVWEVCGSTGFLWGIARSFTINFLFLFACLHVVCRKRGLVARADVMCVDFNSDVRSNNDFS